MVLARETGVRGDAPDALGEATEGLLVGVALGEAPRDPDMTLVRESPGDLALLELTDERSVVYNTKQDTTKWE